MSTEIDRITTAQAESAESRPTPIASNPVASSPVAGTEATGTGRREIPTRKVSFRNAIADLPRYFAKDGDVFTSHMIASFSAVFPDGEDFFVRSVRHFQDRITDPELSRQVAGFVGQEAMHRREHRDLNDRLDELGYPTKRNERRTRRSLKLLRDTQSPEANLAVTAALEHFTATFGEVLLHDENAGGLLGSSPVADLLLWHALEECEHKAVAFDVYKAVGASEKLRVQTMNRVCFSFIFEITWSTLTSVLADRESYRNGNLLKSWRRLREIPLFRRQVWSRLRDYNRADFHPNDHDTTQLETRWTEKLFGAGGVLEPMLAASR